MLRRGTQGGGYWGISRVLPNPMPNTAVLSAESLFPQFSPKLADVATPFEQASIKISSIGVDCVWVRARRPFWDCASSYPSLHGALTDIELSSDVGLAYTAVRQGPHLLIESVPPLPVLLLDR